jgi:hypothetical protein
MQRLTFIGLVALAIVAGGRSIRADSVRLTVRVLNIADLGAEELSRVLSVTRSIYARVGIDVAWIDCSASVAKCSNPLAPHEVWLRIAPGGDDSKGPAPQTLGFANVDPVTKTGVMATVYAGQTARLAQEASISRNTLLAWVAAHELGHLLLGSTSHQSSGLMRAAWSAADLRTGQASAPQFSDDDASGLRAGLARRARAEPTF